jgi:hypothetical protein
MEYVELVLAKKLASPGNVAVTESLPAGTKLVTSSAMPLLVIAAEPKAVPPALNVMFPVATPFGLAADAVLP